MSGRLNDLKRQVGVLRGQFLPDPFHPLGEYSDGELVQARTRAFLVLSHAEIETYLEDWAKDVARAAEKVWTGSRRITPALAFLLACSEGRVSLVESLGTARGGDSHQRLEDLVHSTLRQYYKRIGDNHGVRERNLLSLFDPLGVPSAAYSPTLLPNLDTLGAKRGEHAHYSARTVAVRSVLDPETEHGRIQTILDDLTQLDAWLVRYKRRLR